MRAWLGLVVALTACSGDGTDTDTDTDTTDTTDTDTGTTGCGGPSFVPVYNSILKPSCALAGCHAAGSGNGMDLTDAGAYAEIVDGAAEDAVGETYVIPGDAAGSYVVKKLEDAAGIVGDPMPPPFGTQPVADIETIRAWIDGGACP